MIQIGDIVALKSGHFLREFIEGDCIVDDISISNIRRKKRYHIKSLDGKNCMTWVTLEDINLVSIIREQKLNSILIK